MMRGDAALNARYSAKQRAFAVRDALVALGVAADSIELKKARGNAGCRIQRPERAGLRGCRCNKWRCAPWKKPDGFGLFLWVDRVAARGRQSLVMARLVRALNLQFALHFKEDHVFCEP